jgi:hypothetical protein
MLHKIYQVYKHEICEFIIEKLKYVKHDRPHCRRTQAVVYLSLPDTPNQSCGEN